MTSSDGAVRVLFATTAFGMGVDCQDLDLIAHFDPPSDVDDYCHERGRVGKDQQIKAVTSWKGVMMFCISTLSTHQEEG